MSTARKYFYKSVKIFLLAFVFAVGIPLIFILMIYAGLFENSGLVFWAIYYLKEIAIGIGISVGVFIGALFIHKIYQTTTTKQSPNKEFMRMAPAILFWLVAVYYSGLFLDKITDNTDCQQYNYSDKLNGGIKEIQGEKYFIEICGSGVDSSRFFGDGMDRVKLTITNEKGALLVRRHYEVFWDGNPGHDPIAVGKTEITYLDAGQQQMHAITMPPTFFEWIRARLPFAG